MRSEKTEWGPKIIENQLRYVGCRPSMSRYLFPFDPVRDREMEGRAVGKVYNGQARWTLLVFVEY